MNSPPETATDDSSLKIAAAIVLYYRQLDDTPPKALEMVAWLEKLLPSVQLTLFKQGLRHCLTLPAFLSYVLTARGFSLHTFLEGHLTTPDFASWLRETQYRDAR